MLFLTGVIIAAIAGATSRWWWPRLKLVFKRYGEGVVSREPRAGLSSPEVEMEKLHVEERREMRREMREFYENQIQWLMGITETREQQNELLVQNMLALGQSRAAESRLLDEESPMAAPDSPRMLLSEGNDNGREKKKGGWLRVFFRWLWRVLNAQ